MTSAFVSAFVLAFSTFLPVINPFSGAMFFCTLTTSLSDRDRAFVANRIALYCLIILLVCLTCGHLILSFFGISVGVLRMAGGCVLFAAGWTALNAPTQEETTEEVLMRRMEPNIPSPWPSTPLRCHSRRDPVRLPCPWP